jgi:hypothetical protein
MESLIFGIRFSQGCPPTTFGPGAKFLISQRGATQATTSCSHCELQHTAEARVAVNSARVARRAFLPSLEPVANGGLPSKRGAHWRSRQCTPVLAGGLSAFLEKAKRAGLGHDPEKCEAVFPRDKREAFARRSCSNNNLKRDDDSSSSRFNARFAWLSFSVVGEF